MNTKTPTKKYGFNKLPARVRRYVWIEATKKAGWQSPNKKGDNGSTMRMEWLSYAYTIDEWIEEMIDMGIELDADMGRELMGKRRA